MTKLNKIWTMQILFVLVVCVFAAACSKKNVKQTSALPETVMESVVPVPAEAEGDEGSLRNKKYAQIAEVQTAYFDFDRSELSDKTRSTLQANAAVLKKRPLLEIQIAGHCDERGTTEYNLALAQRRATAVRNYYKALGIKIGRMSTISYGEEGPVCADSTEECWDKNRRAETLVKIQ